MNLIVWILRKWFAFRGKKFVLIYNTVGQWNVDLVGDISDKEFDEFHVNIDECRKIMADEKLDEEYAVALSDLMECLK